VVEAERIAARIAERFVESGREGSRIPLASRVEIVADGELRFVVRVLAPPLRMAGGAEAPAGARSPFLPPYQPTLLVGAISPTHVCLLNKYNVLDRHVLLVTREYEDQDAPLTLADFDAACTCLEACDGLVFYNSGPAAGASQPHKHLQLVPFPLGPVGGRVPLEPAFRAGLAARRPGVAALPFRHRLCRLEAGGGDAGRAGEGAGVPCAREDAVRALETYRAVLATDQLALAREDGRPAPHNLLMTRRWMLVVPRSRGEHRGVEVNALGFAGALAARGEAALALIRSLGPIELLRNVAVPL
jgi:ATP adenylyltransferase